MLPPLIDKRGNVAMIDVIQAPSHQRKTLFLKIDDRGRKVQLAVKPRLHCVLVRGFHIVQMTWLHRANMARDDFLRYQVLLLAADIRQHFRAQKNCDQDGGCNRKPLEHRAARHSNRLRTGLRRKRGADTVPEALRRSLIEIRRPKGIAQSLLIAQLLSAIRAGLQMLLEFEVSNEVEL